MWAMMLSSVCIIDEGLRGHGRDHHVVMIREDLAISAIQRKGTNIQKKFNIINEIKKQNEGKPRRAGAWWPSPYSRLAVPAESFPAPQFSTFSEHR
jgi:hypothetical protein